MNKPTLLLASLGTLFAVSAAPALAESTQLNLSASAQREVANDQISATFYQQMSNTQPAVLADRLNKAAAQGIALGRNYAKVQLSSGGYNTWPNYDKNGKIQSWQGRVEIQLKSRDFAQAAELMAKLQQNLLLQGLQFSVSDQARKEAEQSMLPEAIANLESQAKIAAKAIGKMLAISKNWTLAANHPSSVRR